MTKCMIKASQDFIEESTCLHIYQDRSEKMFLKTDSRLISTIHNKILTTDLSQEDYTMFMRSKKIFSNITMKISNLSSIIKKVTHLLLLKLDC